MKKIIEFTLLLISIIAISVTSVQAKIRSEVVNYQIAGQKYQGYLSYDDTITTKRPGVLVVHEWWGHNTYARKRADMLATMGYTAFALDMYGTGILAQHPENAQKFMQATLADMNVAEARFNVALQLLKLHPTVLQNKIAAIGYCFGGGVALHMARINAGLLGVVSFHGSLVVRTTTPVERIKAKILVLNGADDPFVSTEQIAAFKLEMQNTGANMEFINYPGAKHSFTSKEADNFGHSFDLPLAYNQAADKDSWQRMQVFLQQVFVDH